ncbi:excisionase family DNA binding protein [Massilia sp. UYP11]|uniref:GAF domain-containing protein n=1 Tax=Massilia sp. UYP11 TaxID=1756385 RepID=UPI003D204A38
MDEEKRADDAVITTSKAARMLGVAVSTMQNWMENGSILSWKTPGGHRRTYASAIQALLDGKVDDLCITDVRRLPLPTDPEFLPISNPPFLVSETEGQRLASLALLDLHHIGEDERFDRIVRLSAIATRTSIAAISFFTPRTQWVKAAVGLEIREFPREWSFCNYTIAQNELLTIADAKLDERFNGNPFVNQDPCIRFYAGVPLRDERGLAVGTLCVFDREPRKLRLVELQAFTDLGAIACDTLKGR